MMRKLTVGLLALLLGALSGLVASGASADSDAEKCEKSGQNASSCDFDGDGIDNKADEDDDNDGIPDESDPCSRDAGNTCESEGTEPPGSPIDGLIAQIQQAVADAVGQLPPPPGGVPPVEPPGGLPPVEPPPVEPPPVEPPPVEPPPVEPPADPNEVVGTVQQLIADTVGGLPPVPPA